MTLETSASGGVARPIFGSGLQFHFKHSLVPPSFDLPEPPRGLLSSLVPSMYNATCSFRGVKDAAQCRNAICRSSLRGCREPKPDIMACNDELWFASSWNNKYRVVEQLDKQNGLMRVELLRTWLHAPFSPYTRKSG